MAGVEQYENPEYNLRYSVADVSELEEQLKSQQEKLGKYNPIVRFRLLIPKPRKQIFCSRSPSVGKQLCTVAKECA
jgi:hypothetical protein